MPHPSQTDQAADVSTCAATSTAKQRTEFRYSCFLTQEHLRRLPCSQGHPFYVGNNNEGLRLGQLVLENPPIGGMAAYIEYLSAKPIDQTSFAQAPPTTLAAQKPIKHLVLVLLTAFLWLCVSAEQTAAYCFSTHDFVSSIDVSRKLLLHNEQEVT